MADPSIVRFRNAVAAALAQLEDRRREINDMNVFPVADGDTGDNMAHTMQAVVEELDRLNGLAVDEIGRDVIVSAVARAALLGARGNSGVILSQVVRGAAEELVSRPGELVDPVLMAAALARAANAAYDSVREPAEGTMLTVVREMAHRVTTDLAHNSNARLTGGVSNETQDRVLADLLEGAVEAGEASLERGPQLLPVLREAGVLDAGGAGIIALLKGAIAGLRDEPLPEAPPSAEPARPGSPHHYSSRYQYCTNFVVSGKGMKQQEILPEVELLGDSVLVVGDAETLRVHLHTDDPERAVDVCTRWGDVSHLEIADMTLQIDERDGRLAGNGVPDRAGVPRRTCGVVAVASGDGMHELFRGLGAYVVDGGSTMNPSTVELVAAVHEVNADEVVILPNSPNVIMAADRAAELSEKAVEVVEARSQQAGLACLVELGADRSARENVASLRDALKRLNTGAVALAVRDDNRGRFKSGDVIGLVGDEIVAWGRLEEVVPRVITHLAEGKELTTCFTGADIPLSDEHLAEITPDGAEVEIHRGGQPHYWLLLVAE